MVKNGTVDQDPRKGHLTGEQCVPLGLHDHDHDHVRGHGDDDDDDDCGYVGDRMSQTKRQLRPPMISHQRHACFESLLRQIEDKREAEALQQLRDFPQLPLGTQVK